MRVSKPAVDTSSSHWRCQIVYYVLSAYRVPFIQCTYCKNDDVVMVKIKNFFADKDNDIHVLFGTVSWA